MKKVLVFVVLQLLLFSNQNVWADWALNFVVNDGAMYEISNEPISADLIDRRIGEVTRYSDIEGTYQGNFSNKLPKGTEYYAITGINASSSIAVKTGENSYIKANYAGNYNSAGIWYNYKTWFGMELRCSGAYASLSYFS